MQPDQPNEEVEAPVDEGVYVCIVYTESSKYFFNLMIMSIFILLSYKKIAPHKKNKNFQLKSNNCKKKEIGIHVNKIEI